MLAIPRKDYSTCGSLTTLAEFSSKSDHNIIIITITTTIVYKDDHHHDAGFKFVGDDMSSDSDSSYSFIARTTAAKTSVMPSLSD